MSCCDDSLTSGLPVRPVRVSARDHQPPGAGHDRLPRRRLHELPPRAACSRGPARRSSRRRIGDTGRADLAAGRPGRPGGADDRMVGLPGRRAHVLQRAHRQPGLSRDGRPARKRQPADPPARLPPTPGNRGDRNPGGARDRHQPVHPPRRCSRSRASPALVSSRRFSSWERP